MSYTQVFADTFGRADTVPGSGANSTTGVGNGWLDFIGNVWSITSHTVVQSGAGTNPPLNSLYNPTALSAVNSRIRLSNPSGSTSEIAASSRFTPASGGSGYGALLYNPGGGLQAYFYKAVNGTQTGLLAGKAIPLAAIPTQYGLEFTTLQGSTTTLLVVRVYDATQPDVILPGGTVYTSDSDAALQNVAGACGIACFSMASCVSATIYSYTHAAPSTNTPPVVDPVMVDFNPNTITGGAGALLTATIPSGIGETATATPTGSPILITDIYDVPNNGVQIDQTIASQFINLGLPTGFSTINTTGVTVFAVIAPHSAKAGSATTFYFTEVGDKDMLLTASPTNLSFHLPPSSATDSLGPVAPYGNDLLGSMICQYDPNSGNPRVRVSLDERTERRWDRPTSYTYPTTPTSLNIGQPNANSYFSGGQMQQYGWGGLVLRYLVYYRVLTDTELETLSAWASTTYGLGYLVAESQTESLVTWYNSFDYGFALTPDQTYKFKMRALRGNSFKNLSMGITAQAWGSPIVEVDLDILNTMPGQRKMIVMEGQNAANNGLTALQNYAAMVVFCQSMVTTYHGYIALCDIWGPYPTASTSAYQAAYQTRVKQDFSPTPISGTGDGQYIYLALPGTTYASVLIDMTADPVANNPAGYDGTPVGGNVIWGDNHPSQYQSQSIMAQRFIAAIGAIPAPPSPPATGVIGALDLGLSLSLSL